MGASILPLLRTDLVPNQVAQFGEGDRNAWNSCVPTAELLGVASVSGRRPPDPQLETDAVYGRFYVGGEDAMAAWAWVQANVPDSAGINLVSLWNRLDDIRAALSQRRYVMGFWRCTVDATIVTYETGLYHDSPFVTWYDDGGFDVLNVHDYATQHFSEAEVWAALAFGSLAFDKPIPAPAPPAPAWRPEENMNPIQLSAQPARRLLLGDVPNRAGDRTYVNLGSIDGGKVGAYYSGSDRTPLNAEIFTLAAVVPDHQGPDVQVAPSAALRDQLPETVTIELVLLDGEATAWPHREGA